MSYNGYASCAECTICLLYTYNIIYHIYVYTYIGGTVRSAFACASDVRGWSALASRPGAG